MAQTLQFLNGSKSLSFEGAMRVLEVFNASSESSIANKLDGFSVIQWLVKIEV